MSYVLYSSSVATDINIGRYHRTDKNFLFRLSADMAIYWPISANIRISLLYLLSADIANFHIGRTLCVAYYIVCCYIVMLTNLPTDVDDHNAQDVLNGRGVWQGSRPL